MLLRLLFFQIVSYVAETGLKPTTSPRMTLIASLSRLRPSGYWDLWVCTITSRLLEAGGKPARRACQLGRHPTGTQLSPECPLFRLCCSEVGWASEGEERGGWGTGSLPHGLTKATALTNLKARHPDRVITQDRGSKRGWTAFR